MWRDTNTLDELEFLSENYLIEIIPFFKRDELNLICGKIGPFKPSKPVKVPLWLAIQFKKNKKCRIIPPIWMNEDFLLDKVDVEKKNENLQELPYYFFEICQLLFLIAEEDIDKIKLIKTVIEDISAIRFNKINHYLESVKAEGLVINLNNICARELEMIRPFASEALAMKLEMFNSGINLSEGENGTENYSLNN